MAPLARFAERIFYGIRMMGNDCEKNARWTIRLCAALLPVSYRCRSESEARRKPGLAEAEFQTHGSYIDHG